MQKSISSKEYGVFLEILREARERQGVTQIELANRLDGTQTLISKCERGERRLDVVELRAWCQALGISLESFVKRFEDRLGKTVGLRRHRR